MTELEEYYNKFNEEKRLNSRHGRVEFITSMKYIHDCLGSLMNEKQLDLRSQIKILDVGAGTGRYSVPLAEEGYDVTALELVKHNLGRLKQKSDKVKAYQGNATKLKKFGNDEFDLTLLFVIAISSRLTAIPVVTVLLIRKIATHRRIRMIPPDT